MNTLLLITGVQYACPGGDVDAVMAQMEQEKPEVLLVTEQTNDFGMIVRALVGTDYRGVVSRFDVETALAMMFQHNEDVLVGRVVDTDSAGRCYTISIEGDYTELPKTGHSIGKTNWNDWQWLGTPLMAEGEDDKRLLISIKVVLKELQRRGSMKQQTLLQHLRVIFDLARWDVSQETQQQLNWIARQVDAHPDHEVHSMARELRLQLTAFGSASRTEEFRTVYWPRLLASKEADLMYRQWKEKNREALCSPASWEKTLREEHRNLQQAIAQLPADLCLQQNDFGALMHRLLYLEVPRHKLLMLLSALVLKEKIARALALPDDGGSDEKERWRMNVARRLAPIFHGDVQTAREYIYIIEGRDGKETTRHTRLWIRENRISRDLCHRHLWTILSEEGLYRFSEANWNNQIR